MAKKKKNKKPWTGRTEKQIAASKKNFESWNRLRSKYGTKKAQEIVKKRRSLKEFLKTKRTIPTKEKGAHDLYSLIMDNLMEEERERFRGNAENVDTYVSKDVLDVGYHYLLTEDFEEGQYIDADEFEELLQQWEEWLALD